MVLIALFSLVWVFCGVLTYGFSLAYFQGHWPEIAKQDYLRDCAYAFVLSFTGIYGLIVILIEGEHKYGLMYRNPHKE